MAPVNQKYRFITIGVIASLLHFFMMLSLISAEFRPAFATVLAFLVAFLFAYSAQRNWAFKSNISHRKLLPRYFISQLFCIATAALASEVTHNITLLSENMIVAAVTTIISGGLSYLLSSRWVFVNRTPD